MSAARDWLAGREAGVPRALAARVRAAVRADAGGADAGDELLAAADLVLRNVLAAQPMTRAHALDLLAADALVPYAFEAAADDPPRIPARADAAMQRIASMAAEAR